MIDPMAEPQAPKGEHDPDPFVLATPTHSALPEKGGLQRRVVPIQEIHQGGTSNGSSSPSVAAISDATGAQARPAGGDTDAMQALERSLELERRLDNLMHVLGSHGGVEGSPPEYDGSIAGQATQHYEEHTV